MGQLIKNAPGIIESASKSPLGILALAILVVATVGYLFFRDENLRVRAVIYLTMLTGLVAYGIAIRQAVIVKQHEHEEAKPQEAKPQEAKPQEAKLPVPTEVVYSGRVIDEASQSSIKGARVEADISGVSPTYTDSNGQYRIQASRTLDGNRVRVTAKGYHPYDEIVSFESSNKFADIRLTKIEPQPARRRSPTETVQVRLWVTVNDEETHLPIQDAAVTLTIDEREPIRCYTDSHGDCVFNEVPSGALGHIGIMARNYKPFVRHFSPENRNELRDIRLQRKPTP